MPADNKNTPTNGINAEELEIMLKVYKIGKKPLAKLLGWGETTIILYAKDGFPGNEYTVRLKELFNNPAEYAEVLLENGGAISNVAFKKSYEAVCGYFPLNAVSEAALFAANYLGENLGTPVRNDYGYNSVGDGVSLLRLESILFWSQVLSISLFDKPLFEEDYQPGHSGFPFRSIEERLVRYNCIRPGKLYPDNNMYTPTLQEKEIIMTVADAFAWYGKKSLNALAEAEHFRLCGPKGARKRRIASAEILKRCYSEVFEQAKVKKLKDFEGYLHKRMVFIRKELAKQIENAGI
ncbi:MAG: hypothetical protein IK071_00920 [Lachnospiraceae bacterium]|nr:hypothetical protein [Lachnospiraceae bacterium]